MSTDIPTDYEDIPIDYEDIAKRLEKLTPEKMDALATRLASELRPEKGYAYIRKPLFGTRVPQKKD